MKVIYNKYSLLLYSVAGIIVFYLISVVSFSDIRNLIYIIPDDSSYYLKIAENFSNGLWMTFDGINKTNGFQPLWQFILIPVFFVTDTTPENTLRIVLILQIILVSLALLIFCKTLSKIFDKRILPVFVIIFLFYVFINAVNGMETALLIFMFSMLFYYGLKFKIFAIRNSKFEIIWGLILGILILARLDMVFLALSFGLFIVFSNVKNKFSKVSFIYIGVAIILLPYLLFNFIEFGNIIPISGYLKSTFPEINFFDKLKEVIRYRETYFFLCGLLYLIWFILKYKKLSESKNFYFYLFLSSFAFGNLLLFLYLIFFLNWVIFYWYFITYSLFFAIFICIPVSHFLSLNNSGNLKIIFRISVLIFIFYRSFKLFNALSLEYKSPESNWNVESYIASQWAKQNTNPEDILAMKDTGHFAFFSERKVINLDGLVNSFEYQEILNNKILNKYLQNNNVIYIVQHAFPKMDNIINGDYDTLNLKYISHKYSTESDPVILHKADEVYRSDLYSDFDKRTVFLIWKYKPN